MSDDHGNAYAPDRSDALRRRRMLEEIDRSTARGLADAGAGRFEPAEQVFARIRRELDLPK